MKVKLTLLLFLSLLLSCSPGAKNPNVAKTEPVVISKIRPEVAEPSESVRTPSVSRSHIRPPERKVVKKIAPKPIQKVVKSAPIAAKAPQKVRKARRPIAKPITPTKRRSAVRNLPSRGLNWKALRKCESGGNYSINTGNGYYGAYQFDLRTWRSVGGSGSPHNASKGEQDMRAQILYNSRGRRPWPVCGKLL